ncbi:class F sortase [Kribbella sp. NPDC003557]|uniref:class F sortase n=1 Tax=Kribbella sp. NPDC003557 TaxID=3154449 RepID=UPI0033A82F08
MTDPAANRPPSRRGRIPGIVAAVLGTAGIAATALAVAAQRPSPPAPDPDQPPPAAAKASRGPARATPPSSAAPKPSRVLELPRSEPELITVPRLKISSPLEDLQLDDQGAMQVPKNPAKAGWFTPSPPPGSIGSSVIAGHVTWNKRPAVFFRLGELRPGDQINIQRANRTTAVFTVERIAQFPKDRFPSEKVYDAAPYPALRLITCGGTYDNTNHRYLDNVIVWARLTASRP